MSNKEVAEPCFFPNGSNTNQVFFTPCVLGTPRGGTSMVSGILKLMGINMGDVLDEANLEDQEFLAHQGDRRVLQDPAHPARNDFLNHIRASIDKKNNAYSIWGWKDPLSIFYLPNIADLLRNPIYIWITRDLIAISEREFMTAKVNREPLHVYNFVNQALSHYQRISSFLCGQNQPVLFVSYERALRNPSALYFALAEFIGLEKDPAVLEQVFDYVQPDRLTANLSYSPGNQRDGTPADYEKHHRNSLKRPHKIRAMAMFHETDTTIGESNVLALIKAAEGDMLDRQFQACISKLERALLHFEKELPAVIYGPQAISASLRYSIGQPNVPGIEDVAVKILYLIGMSQLQMGNPHDSIIWFSATFDLASRKLMYRQAPLQDSERYLVWAKFHEAFSAKQLASINLLNEARRELETLKYTSSYMVSDVVKTAYNEAIKRAVVELAV